MDGQLIGAWWLLVYMGLTNGHDLLMYSMALN
jgi:hypothetical protein